MTKQAETDRNPRQLMRVEFPAPLTDDTDSTRVFGGIELIGFLINTQPQFNMDKAGLQAGIRLEIAMNGKTNQTPLLVEWRDLQLLKEAVKKPRNGYPIQPARLCMPFINAFDVATEHEPSASIELETPTDTDEAAD